MVNGDADADADANYDSYAQPQCGRGEVQKELLQQELNQGARSGTSCGQTLSNSRHVK